VGRAAVVEAVRTLDARAGSAGFALSYHPENLVAKRLYASLGFVETGEVVDDEAVARRSPA
jgi:diamine N-acetyltransferase